MSGQFELALRRFAEKAGDNADLAVRKIVLDLNARLVARSPVDTGRFRANWQYGFGAAPAGSIEIAGTSESPAPPSPPPVLPKGTGVGVHYLVNNLPYAQALERGYSKQAPLGLVGLTVIEFSGLADRVGQEVFAGAAAIYQTGGLA